jgi:Flp pilus assembly protein TadD
MKQLTLLSAIILVIGLTACASKHKPLVPLALVDAGVKPQALSLTEQGTQAYQAKQFGEAKTYFEQAVSAAPESGQAHYNYGLALHALGEADGARQHFLEAANLAPGDKTIWDSPPLAAYGDPQKKGGATKDRPYGTVRPNFCKTCGMQR